MWLVTACFLAAALGSGVLRLLVDAVTRARVGPVVMGVTALALGVGLSSVLWLGTAALLWPDRWISGLVEASVAAALWWRGGPRPHAVHELPASAARPPLWLVSSAAVGVCAAIASFGAQCRVLPLGGGDALAIWGHRAVQLHRAFGQWDLVFAKHIVHADYPLLLPASLARAWCFAGVESPWAGIALALLFGAVTFAALGASVTRLRGGTLGALALLGLSATPSFVIECASQAADVPLACYTLLAAVWWRLAGGDGLRVCGACLGCCAWTKNEGALVALIMFGWLLLEQRRMGGGLAFRRTLALCLVGALPMVVALLAFKLCWAPRNDLIDNQKAANLVPMLTSLDRWTTIARSFGRWFICSRTGDAHPGLTPLVLVLLWLGGRRRGAGFWLGMELGTSTTMAAALFLVFVLTPYDVQWHLDTALDRVLLQTWPLALFGVACSARDSLHHRPESPVAAH